MDGKKMLWVVLSLILFFGSVYLVAAGLVYNISQQEIYTNVDANASSLKIQVDKLEKRIKFLEGRNNE